MGVKNTDAKETPFSRKGVLMLSLPHKTNFVKVQSEKKLPITRQNFPNYEVSLKRRGFYQKKSDTKSEATWEGSNGCTKFS